jgi:hypothetical protein
MDDYSRQLLDAVDAVVGIWVERMVRTVASSQNIELTPSGEEQLADAVATTRLDVHQRLHDLLSTDVDAQRANPLDVLRRSVSHATEVLRVLGARPVHRDDFAVRMFPDDVYALSPAAFADVDESLVEPGIMWGAFKAKTVLDRRRAEGRLPSSDDDPVS